MTPLHDLVALVAGASGDIGRAIALALAEAGATLWLVGRRPAVLSAVAEAARRATPHVMVHPADLTAEADVQALRDRVARDGGRLDILIHSVGIVGWAPLETAPIADLDAQYRANLRAPYLLTQAMLPLLCAKRGQVVFINSSAGLEAGVDGGQYAASKHGLRAIADSLRQEVNARGVRVTSVYVGRTAGAVQARLFERERRAYRPELLVQPTNVAAMVTAILALPRTAEVTEIRMRPLAKSY